MKRLSISIAAIVILLGAFVAYSYFTPDITIAISKPVDPAAESYAQQVLIGGATKYGLPMPEKTKARMQEFAQATQAVTLELYENYALPMQVTVAVATTGGQTIVTYSGTVTDENGTAVPYHKEVVFDFIITKDIRP